MIVYVKNSNGVRQLTEIDFVDFEEHENYGVVSGYYKMYETEHHFKYEERAWSIKCKDMYRAMKIYQKIKRALNNNENDVLIHLYNDEGAIIE